MILLNIQWEFQESKMEVRQCTIFQAIFSGDIPEMAIDQHYHLFEKTYVYIQIVIISLLKCSKHAHPDENHDVSTHGYRVIYHICYINRKHIKKLHIHWSFNIQPLKPWPSRNREFSPQRWCCSHGSYVAVNRATGWKIPLNPIRSAIQNPVVSPP